MRTPARTGYAALKPGEGSAGLIQDGPGSHAPRLQDLAQQEETQSLLWHPDDGSNKAFLAFMLLGLGIMQPFNTVIISDDFYKLQWPDTDALFLFAVAYQTMNLVAYVWVLSVGSTTRFRFRIVPGFLFMLFCTAALPYVSDFTWAVVILGAIGLGTSIVQASVFSLASVYSGRYMGALMAGQGWSGLLTAGLKVMSKGALPQNESGTRVATEIFFGIGDAVLVACIVAYFFLERSHVTRHYTFLSSAHIRDEFATYLPALDHRSQRQLDLSDALDSGDEPDESRGAGRNWTYWSVFVRTWKWQFTVFLVFTITLALFPAITAAIPSQWESLNDSRWMPVITMSLFMVGDVIGRQLPTFWMPGQRSSFWAGLARLAFFPLFILAARGAFNHDGYSWAIMLAFGVSNGLVSTMAMILVSADVPGDMKSAAGTLGVTMLTIGLTSGSWLGFAIGKLNLVDKKES